MTTVPKLCELPGCEEPARRRWCSQKCGWKGFHLANPDWVKDTERDRRRAAREAAREAAGAILSDDRGQA